MSKVSRVLHGTIPTTWAGTIEDYRDGIIAWMDRKSLRDEARAEREADAIAAHQAAYDRQEVSFPPAYTPKAAEAYVAFVFDERNGDLYQASDTWLQENKGRPPWSKASGGEAVVTNITQVTEQVDVAAVAAEAARLAVGPAAEKAADIAASMRASSVEAPALVDVAAQHLQKDYGKAAAAKWLRRFGTKA